MNPILNNGNSQIQIDMRASSEQMAAANRVKIAYQGFGANQRVDPQFRASRCDYFLSIDEFHAKFFFDPGTQLHRDLFLNEAEKLLRGEGRFAYVPFVRCRLSKLAVKYVEAFEELGDALSMPQIRLSEMAKRISRIERAHFAFVDRFERESTQIKNYQSILRALLFIV